MSKKTIVQKHSKNFETLKRVFDNGHAVLMECKLKSTEEKVAVICAMTKDKEEFVFTPFAMFFNGNPYELLESPTTEG